MTNNLVCVNICNMNKKIKKIVERLGPNKLEIWYKKLNNKKYKSGLTLTQKNIYKAVEDRLWYEFRV